MVRAARRGLLLVEVVWVFADTFGT